MSDLFNPNKSYDDISMPKSCVDFVRIEVDKKIKHLLKDIVKQITINGSIAQSSISTKITHREIFPTYHIKMKWGLKYQNLKDYIPSKSSLDDKYNIEKQVILKIGKLYQDTFVEQWDNNPDLIKGWTLSTNNRPTLDLNGVWGNHPALELESEPSCFGCFFTDDGCTSSRGMLARQLIEAERNTFLKINFTYKATKNITSDKGGGPKII